MANAYFNPSGNPATGSEGLSSLMRGEFAAISAAFDLLPVFTANGGKVVVVNPGGTAMTVTVGTLALAGNLSTTGAFNTIFAQSASITITLPGVAGTLATLTGTETLTNKTLVAPALGTPASGVATNLTGTAAGLTAGTATTAATATNQSGGTVAATTLSASGAVSGAGFVALHASPGPIGNTAASTGAFTTLSATSTVSGAGFTAWAASPPAIGGTAPAAGAFTTLSTTGVLTTLTAAPGTNTTQAATTAYSTAAVLVETTRALAAETLLAPKASPALTGNPTAPTAAPGDNDTSIATTAYSTAAIAVETAARAAADALLAPLASPTFTGPVTAGTGGSSGNQAVVFAQFAPLVSAVGYIHLPGGVTLQWGNASSAVGTLTVTFPISFSTGVWAITAMLKDATGGGPASPVGIEVTTVYTNAGFNVLTFDTTTGALAACNFFWFAVGPT